MRFSIVRLFTLGVIFVAAVLGWWFLGTVTMHRANLFSSRLGDMVESLWGAPLIQEAPRLYVKMPGSDKTRQLLPSKNDIEVALDLDYRRKGLVWYSTFVCDFSGTYAVTNTDEVARKVRVHFRFPSAARTYDRFSFNLDGEKLDIPVDTAEGINEIVEVEPGRTREFRVTYRTRGLGEWRYRPDREKGRYRRLSMAVRTDFHDYDFPEGSLSPMKKEREGDGMLLTWSAEDLLTSQDIGVVMPERLNPGPLSGRVTFFAPVCLFFFFLMVTTISILKGVPIHPMHYLFVAAGFFAFHLLFAYLVDHLNVHLSFVLSAAVSVGLVTGYLAAVLRGAFPWKIAVAGQLFYLVLFSYSFFLEGMTGLTVTIGSVVTLAVLMRLTAHVDWEKVFVRPGETLPSTTV